MSLSLLNPTDPFSTGLAIHYCSPLLPARTAQGAGKATNGVDFVQYFTDHGVACSPGVQRRRGDPKSGKNLSGGKRLVPVDDTAVGRISDAENNLNFRVIKVGSFLLLFVFAF